MSLNIHFISFPKMISLKERNIIKQFCGMKYYYIYQETNIFNYIKHCNMDFLESALQKYEIRQKFIRLFSVFVRYRIDKSPTRFHLSTLHENVIVDALRQKNWGIILAKFARRRVKQPNPPESFSREVGRNSVEVPKNISPGCCREDRGEELRNVRGIVVAPRERFISQPFRRARPFPPCRAAPAPFLRL